MPHYDDDNMSQYSQVNVMSAYVSMIRFAMDKLELHLDELGDDILFEGMSPFPDDVLGDDTLFAGYTDPWSPDDECKCDDCRCRSADPWGVSEDSYYSDKMRHRDAAVDLSRMGVGNIMDLLKGTRKAPQDYRMD